MHCRPHRVALVVMCSGESVYTHCLRLSTVLHFSLKCADLDKLYGLLPHTGHLLVSFFLLRGFLNHRVYMHVHVCVHVVWGAFACMFACTCICVCTCAFVWTYAHICVRMHVPEVPLAV